MPYVEEYVMYVRSIPHHNKLGLFNRSLNYVAFSTYFDELVFLEDLGSLCLVNERVSYFLFRDGLASLPKRMLT